MADVDWEAIRLEYISTDVSYRGLAAKYGVQEGAIYRRGSADGWVAAREKWRSDMRAKAARKTASVAASSLAKQAKLDKLLDSADLLSDSIQLSLTERRGLLQSKDGASIMDSRALRDYAMALQTAVSVMRNLCGLPTVQEQEAMDMARARLELEERKAAQGTVDESETGVVVIPEIAPLDEPADEEAGEE